MNRPMKLFKLSFLLVPQAPTSLHTIPPQKIFLQMDGSIATECHHNKQTPLIHSHQGNVKRTPLPKLQIGILLFLQINEPLCSMSIYPYINELVSKLDIIGGDTRKIGYYAGLIVEYP
ncbi:hypothetical protein BYT27DRAFT_6370089 [Phlegmacium glaucopus]|nr:hypothetical protein BYT27DRAFT_6370089 [Phlegmacium glaucopus]